MRGLLQVLMLLAAGCSGGECKDAVAQLCEKACECGTAEGNCAFGDASGGLSFDSVADCRALFGLGCSGDSDVDWAACETALEGATCEAGRLVVPDSCDTD